MSTLPKIELLPEYANSEGWVLKPSSKVLAMRLDEKGNPVYRTKLLARPASISKEQLLAHPQRYCSLHQLYFAFIAGPEIEKLKRMTPREVQILDNQLTWNKKSNEAKAAKAAGATSVAAAAAAAKAKAKKEGNA